MTAPGKRLTRREFDDVIRRASELAARETDAGEGALEESELLRIANEVGLPERHVRLALAEVRSGGVRSPAPSGAIEALFGPETVRASRVVPGTPRALAAKLDGFFVAGQLLQAVRKTDQRLQYRPAVDWMSQVARAASAAARNYYVASSRSVEVRLVETDPGETLVDLEVDPGTRNDAIGGAVAGGLAGAVAGAGAGFALALVGPPEMALWGGVLGVLGIGGVAGTGAGGRHRRRLHEVHAEIEGILDRLERGETLEPPPASWRQWVKRHFNGVAKDFLAARND
jgi:hypothetical protein